MREAIHKVEPLVAAVVQETNKLSQSQEAFRTLLVAIFTIMAAGLAAGGLVFSAVCPFPLHPHPQDGRPAGEPRRRVT